MKTNIYLDQDGVLANFNEALSLKGITHPKSDRLQQSFVDKKNWTTDELAYDKQIHEVMKEPGFFRNLSPMIGYKELWATAGERRFVLTARPKDEVTAQRVRAEKQAWIDFHFGNTHRDRFICCLRSEKKLYAKGCILVDDLEWNCSEWEKAGGRAILYKTSEQAIKELKKEMNR